MQFGRRYWATAGVGAFLAALAVALARPVLLVGVAGLGAWLCARQLQFVRTLARTRAELRLTHEVPATIPVGREVGVQFDASLLRPTPLDLAIEATPPVVTRGSTAEERTIRLGPTTREAQTLFTVEWPVAGTFAFDPADVVAASRDGLFRARLPSGLDESVVVEPPQPTDVHVGASGSSVATGVGERDAGRPVGGIDPADLREYVPGDSASRIDWKATARLADPYVRERESNTNRNTVLLVDHRATLDTGRVGRTQLDYLRQVALALLPNARDHDDAIGLHAVGDEGVTDRVAPRTTDDQYAAVRRRLHDLSPTRSADVRADSARSPADARRAARALDSGDDFATTLRPYFAAADPYVARVERDPLVAATKTACSRLDDSAWVVVLTDDTNRVQIREAVKLARRGGRHVTVFLSPDALFDPADLADVEAAYDRYASFERFRRDLDGLARVSAFEVGPSDRVDALLNRRQKRPSPP